MTVTRTDYSVPAGGRLGEEVRLAFLSDLHGEDYGPGQAPLFEILDSFSPHAVLIGGDAYDERRPWTKTSETIRLCAERRPTFYTPGNHEAETKKLNECCADAEANGAVLLLGTSSLLEIGTNGDRILLCGAGDPRKRAEGYAEEMDKCAAACEEHPDLFRILMTHHPERIADYRSHPADLILTGHAHGGQWRFPFLKNGLFAPEQGLFPKYTGGMFLFERNRMICSRGLGNATPFPRFGNPPEIVCVTLATP